jgi:hypothetical protein
MGRCCYTAAMVVAESAETGKFIERERIKRIFFIVCLEIARSMRRRNI